MNSGFCILRIYKADRLSNMEKNPENSRHKDILNSSPQVSFYLSEVHEKYKLRDLVRTANLFTH